MEIDKSQTKASSKISLKSNANKDGSDIISMSQLELLANKKKLNKKSEEISIDIKKDKDSSKDSSKVSSKKEKSSQKSSSISYDKYDKNDKKDKRDKKKISKENNSESIRKEKGEFLFKLHTIIEKSGGRWSSRLTMDDSIDEIKSEFIRIKTTLDHEGLVTFYKQGLVMGIKGLEILNNSYDPFGIDLNGWGEAMSYNMSSTQYDEVLLELCEKYSTTSNMAPELKLLVMIIMSGVSFSVSKTDMLSNLMGSFMAKSKPQLPKSQLSSAQPPHHHQSQQSYQQPQKSYQPPQQDYQHQVYHQQTYQPHQQQTYQQQTYQPHQQQEYQQQEYQQPAESVESDNVPSRLKGLSFDKSDSLNIAKIIKTIKEKTKNIEIDEILNKSDTTDEVVRDIPMPLPKQRKPRQTKKTKQ